MASGWLRFFWVFSAHAEVVPRQYANQSGSHGILRARGGSSKGATAETASASILRARGGSSTIKEVFSAFFVYSPRTRR